MLNLVRTGFGNALLSRFLQQLEAKWAQLGAQKAFKCSCINSNTHRIH